MPPAGLIDTGAIVAIVNTDESRHSACVEALASVQMPLLTTEAVLTELFHLIFARSLSLERAWLFVRSGALSVRPMDDSDLPALHALMAQYADRPMDFADATLVHLAARESLSLILTVDHDDFETYRIAGRKRFTILPDRKRKA
ncbi:MAG: type II toxin-antitoxin system VapC family toxin [Terriglobales bacterium]